MAIKHQGNTFFEKREYTDALKAYTQAFAMVRDEVVEYDSSMKGLVLASWNTAQHSSWNTRPVRSMSTTPELRAVSANAVLPFCLRACTLRSSSMLSLTGAAIKPRRDAGSAARLLRRS